MLAGCSKDEILNHYNNIVQSAGSIELTGKSSLQGEKEKGIDDYTGTYTADYANFSGTEYLFGGTSIKREAGKELSIDCTLEITEGTAKVFWISGSDEAVTLIEATGTYSDTITLPDGGNYIGDGSGGKTVSGAGLCRCGEAAGETGKANLCPILSGNDGK